MFRRIVFLILGVLECLAAIVLLAFAGAMPGAAEVHDGAARVEDLTGKTSAQVARLREELHTLREQRPKLRAMAENLRVQMDLATKNLQGQRIDCSGVQTVGDALGSMAKGLDGLSDALDPDSLQRIADGFKGAADFLDDQVAPAAARAADQLNESTAALGSDVRELGRLLRAAPIDLKAARQIHDGLGRFTDSLDRLNARLDADRIDSLRDSFTGVEGALTTGADEVERASDLTYPTVRLVGLTPIVNQQPFWPDGKKIADGLRRASRGASEANAELDSLGVDLPKLHESLNESRKVAEATRDALGPALRQQDQAEGLLKDAPEHAARLADELPKLSADLSKVLRDTKRLQEASDLLRKAQKGLATATVRWPALRKTLTDSARLLRAPRGKCKTPWPTATTTIRR